jgi:hypothetical protein
VPGDYQNAELVEQIDPSPEAGVKRLNASIVDAGA